MMAVVVVFWISGIVVAKGWFSTLVAVLFPPFAWYLIAERLFIAWGLL